jgi:hypothetical protein
MGCSTTSNDENKEEKIVDAVKLQMWERVREHVHLQVGSDLPQQLLLKRTG